MQRIEKRTISYSLYEVSKTLITKPINMDFPVGAVGKNPPANRFDPWSRKIPHTTEQLSPCATTTEPAL